jgi:hypothetical protein
MSLPTSSGSPSKPTPEIETAFGQIELPTPRREGERKYIYIPSVDIIYHNMCAGSDFTTVRMGSDGPVEDVLLEVARQVKDGCYKIVSIAASKHSFVVVCSTELSEAELWKKGFPFASTKGQEREERA